MVGGSRAVLRVPAANDPPAPGAIPIAISVDGLRKSYGDTEALRGVTFTVARGAIFALLGPNGAGKTTTVEILEGHRSRTAGDVSVLGLDPEHGGRDLRGRIGISSEERQPRGGRGAPEPAR